MFIAELAVGLYSGSLAMLSDSFHLFLDTLAPLISYLSEFKFFGLSEDRIKKTVTQVSISLFFIVAGVIIWEAVSRIINPPELKINFWFFLVAIIGLIGNIYSFLILKKEEGEDYSIIRKLLSRHMLADAGGSIVVILGAIGIAVWNLNVLDPILSIILAVFIILAPFIH
ncbi:MAG: cation transporter [Candidatus Yanofskybacteria bacterium]|nr:cation transporter [Candidatus Yanofskybacteria bacterium]